MKLFERFKRKKRSSSMDTQQIQEKQLKETPSDSKLSFNPKDIAWLWDKQSGFEKIKKLYEDQKYQKLLQMLKNIGERYWLTENFLFFDNYFKYINQPTHGNWKMFFTDTTNEETEVNLAEQSKKLFKTLNQASDITLPTEKDLEVFAKAVGEMLNDNLFMRINARNEISLEELNKYHPDNLPMDFRP